MSILTHIDAAYSDTYRTDVLFEAHNDHPPIRATTVTVQLSGVSEPGTQREVKVLVSVTGERLERIADGWASAGPAIRAYGLGEEPVRYGVCHAAVLDALERHGVAPEEVSGFAFLQTWEEHQQALDSGTADMSGMRTVYASGSGPLGSGPDPTWMD